MAYVKAKGKADKYWIIVKRPGDKLPIHQAWTSNKKDIHLMAMPPILREFKPPHEIFCVLKSGFKEGRPFRWKWNFKLELFDPILWMDAEYAYGNSCGKKWMTL